MTLPVSQNQLHALERIAERNGYADARDLLSRTARVSRDEVGYLSGDRLRAAIDAAFAIGEVDEAEAGGYGLGKPQGRRRRRSTGRGTGFRRGGNR